MKHTLLILLIVISLPVFGQLENDTSGIKLFNRGLDFYNKGDLDSALTIWIEIVDNRIGLHYDTYGNAFFNIPTIYWQMKNYDKAKEWYKKVLSSDLRDNDETGSLMEPHTNYKHKSAVALAGLYQLDSNYNEVLRWLGKADTLYRYWGFEGSATNVSEEQAYLLDWKIDVLLKLGKQEDAVQTILTELICSRNLESFFSKSEDRFLLLVDRKTFKADFDLAINNLTMNQVNDSTWVALFNLHGLDYKIPIRNTHPDRNLPHYWTFYFIEKNQSPQKTSLIDYMKQRSFYKRLAS